MSEFIIDWDENLVIDTFSKNSLREEVVRCRDCKHLSKLSREHEVYECCLTYMDVTLNGFCAWGERMVGE